MSNKSKNDKCTRVKCQIFAAPFYYLLYSREYFDDTVSVLGEQTNNKNKTGKNQQSGTSARKIEKARDEEKRSQTKLFASICPERNSKNPFHPDFMYFICCTPKNPSRNI